MAAAWHTAAAQDKDHNLEVAKQLEIFCSICRDLDLMYVDSLNAKELVETGIHSMLHSLDPYTTYYPQADVKDLKQMITGKYGGIGSVVSYSFKDSATVINEPYWGMPAQEMGLKKGDVILSIDGEDMRGKAVSYVSEHLRGEAGSNLLIKVLRKHSQNSSASAKTNATKKAKGKKSKKGDKDLYPDGDVLTFKVTRRAIQTPCLPYYGMVEDGIGYISFSQFTDECSKDVRRAVLDLKRQGMKKMVFDLRSNGGGSLSEAVEILNMFLPKDITLVKTKGKLERANRDYKTQSMPIDTVMPIVVMVNGNTASAAEIMSGSLQDLDRGVVLGVKTFGKGLVQVPLDLPYNGNLKLTTARYYIPSGRCIQAINYNHSNGGSREAVADSLKREFKTLHGRLVKDGGGIMPDVTVEADSLPNIVYYLSSAALDSTNVMMEYVVDYVRRHPQISPAREFSITDEDYSEFCDMAIKNGFKYDRESERFLKELIKVAKFEGYYDRSKDEFDALEKKLQHDLKAELEFHKEIIKQTISNDIVTCYYYQAGGIEHSLLYDSQVKAAIGLLKDDTRYNSILKP